MAPLAYFGIESSGLNLVIDLLILFLSVLYLSLIYWTYADARRRIEDPILVWCATAAAAFPFVGAIVYMVVRPPEYLDDVRERELETQAAEVRLHELQQRLCPHCDYPVEREFVRCPSCLRKLRERCVSCSRPLDRTWAICPYCETEAPAAAGRRGARRRTASDGAHADIRGSAGAGAELAEIGGSRAKASPRPARRADDDPQRPPVAASEAARNLPPVRSTRRPAGPPPKPAS